jgi:adenosylhomocysteine nucleosidase
MQRFGLGIGTFSPLFALVHCLFCPSAWSHVAILGALPVEIEQVVAALENKTEETIKGVHFFIGELHGAPMVASVTGAGKVNAAITATLLIEHFEPQSVIFTGVAGALNPSLGPGDIVIGTKTAQHDLMTVDDDGREGMTVRSPITGKECPEFFECDQILLDAARGVVQKRSEGPNGTRAGKGEGSQIREGIIVSGDAFVASDQMKIELHQRLGADAVDMESAAVAYVCDVYLVPFIAIRSFSDSADGMAMLDFRRFFKTAAHRSSRFVMEMVGVLCMQTTDNSGGQ